MSEIEDETPETDWIRQTLAMRGISVIPSRLFKFLSADSKYFALTLHELMLHHRIRLSCRKEFNDPFDTSVEIEQPASAEEIRNFISGFRGRNPSTRLANVDCVEIGDPNEWTKRAQEGLEDSFDKLGIFSLADSVRNPLMWAHYASAHRGVALIFRHGMADSFGAFPIRYQDDYPRTNLSAMGFDVYQALAKGKYWEYEGEWRIVEPNMAREWHVLPETCLVGIVFGARSSQETTDLFLDLAQRRHEANLLKLHLYRANVGRSFALEFLKWKGDGWQVEQLP
jgi:hypothetical protein